MWPRCLDDPDFVSDPLDLKAPVGSDVDSLLFENYQRDYETKHLREKEAKRQRQKQKLKEAKLKEALQNGGADAGQQQQNQAKPQQSYNPLTRYKQWKKKNTVHDARERDWMGNLRDPNDRKREEAKKRLTKSQKKRRKKKKDEQKAMKDNFDAAMDTYGDNEGHAVDHQEKLRRDRKWAKKFGLHDGEDWNFGKGEAIAEYRNEQHEIADTWGDYAKKVRERNYALDVFIHNIAENYKVKEITQKTVGKLHISDDVKNKLGNVLQKKKDKMARDAAREKKLNDHLKLKAKLLRERDEWNEPGANQQQDDQPRVTNGGPDAQPDGEADVEVLVNSVGNSVSADDNGAAHANNNLGEGEGEGEGGQEQQPQRNDGKLVDDVSNEQLGRNDSLDQGYDMNQGIDQNLGDHVDAEDEMMNDFIAEMNGESNP